MSELNLTVEDDPVPIVKIMAARFRRAMHHPDFLTAARAMRGKLGLKSSKDPQALTIELGGNSMHLVRGIERADAVIELDLDTGKVAGIRRAWRHPLLIWRATKLLVDPPRSWQDTAKRFWSLAATREGMPGGIRVRSTDDNAELLLGDDSADVDIEGSGEALAAVFGGDTIFVEAIIRGRIRAVCSMQHLAIISEATVLNLQGEL